MGGGSFGMRDLLWRSTESIVGYPWRWDPTTGFEGLLRGKGRVTRAWQRCSSLTRAGGFAKKLFQANGSRASSKTRGRRQRLTGPTTVAGFYGGRPRYVIHGGAGTLTWPRLFGSAAKIAVARDGPGWIRRWPSTGPCRRLLGRNADRLAHAAAVQELIRQLVDRFGGKDPVAAPPLVPRLDARVPIIC